MFAWLKKLFGGKKEDPVKEVPLATEEKLEQAEEPAPVEGEFKEEPIEEPVEVVEEEEKQQDEPTEEPKLDLSSKTVAELKELAKEKGLTGYSALKKAELIELLEKA